MDVTRTEDEVLLQNATPEMRQAWEIAMLKVRVTNVEHWQKIMDARMWLLVGGILTVMTTIILRMLHLLS